MTALNNIQKELNKLPLPLTLKIDLFSGILCCSINYGNPQDIFIINIKNSKQAQLPIELQPYLIEYNIKESDLFSILENIKNLLLTFSTYDKKNFTTIVLAKKTNNTWVDLNDKLEWLQFMKEHPSFKVKL